MVSSSANQPIPDRSYSAKKDESVLSSEPQFFVGLDPAATVEEMENAIWQNIGGHEIISLVRRDLVDGVNIDYSLINNLKQLFQEYNPRTIFSIQNSSAVFFERFGIKLEKYIPSIRSLQAVDSDLKIPVIFDPLSGVSILVRNIAENEEVEVETITSQKISRDTIYGELS